jgi:hypothetical protein
MWRNNSRPILYNNVLKSLFLEGFPGQIGFLLGNSNWRRAPENLFTSVNFQKRAGIGLQCQLLSYICSR